MHPQHLIVSQAMEVIEPYDDRTSEDSRNRRSQHNQNAAISCLPVEILGVIFVLLQHTPFPPSDERAKAEITISHVTRHWRDVAIHSPLLWTHIDLSPPQKLDAIAAYVQRSEACALAVHYCHPIKGVDADERSLNVNLIMGHVHRWKSFYLSGPSSVIDRIGLRLRFFVAPLLQQLSRVDQHHAFPYNVTPRDQCPPTVFLGGTPILSSVHLQLQGRDLPFFCPSLGSVKNLSLSLEGFKNYRLISNVLTAAPFLETLYFQVDRDNYSPAPWPSEDLDYIKMPHLHSLCIKSPEFSCRTARMAILGLLRTLQTPQLHSITLQSVIIHNPFQLRFIFDDLQIISGTKFPLLRSLAFIDCTIDALSYRRFAQYFSTVTCLSVACSYSAPGCEILRDMASYPSEYKHWLHMDTISVNIRVLGDIEDVLCRIVSNQMIAGSPIHKVRLNRDAPLTMRRLEWLREHVEVEPFLTWDDDP